MSRQCHGEDATTNMPVAAKIIKEPLTTTDQRKKKLSNQHVPTGFNTVGSGVVNTRQGRKLTIKVEASPRGARAGRHSGLGGNSSSSTIAQ